MTPAMPSLANEIPAIKVEVSNRALPLRMCLPGVRLQPSFHARRRRLTALPVVGARAFAPLQVRERRRAGP